jgi:hypothetical protein
MWRVTTHDAKVTIGIPSAWRDTTSHTNLNRGGQRSRRVTPHNMEIFGGSVHVWGDTMGDTKANRIIL